MPIHLSIYLDILRFVASLTVAIGHFPNKGFSGPSIPILDLGHSAVIIFFVLSGYVIAYIAQRDKTLFIFAINRMARLWSVTIPAVFLTYVLFLIGRHFNPSIYNSILATDKPIIRILCNIFFLQGIHGLAVTLFNNGPLWSLANEFWYYVIFAIFTYLKKPATKFILIFTVIILIGWNIISLFPIWLLGVLVFKYASFIRLNRTRAIFLFVGSLILFYAFNIPKTKYEPPLLLSDYINGIIIAINITSFYHIKVNFSRWIEKSSRFLSSFTFSLYLFHLPILYFIASMINYDKNNLLNVIAIFILVVITCFVLSLFTERQKHAVRSLIILIGKHLQFLPKSTTENLIIPKTKSGSGLLF
jgi:peptidoglycan/LPS O-acetylase OafA/YrhL